MFGEYREFKFCNQKNKYGGGSLYLCEKCVCESQGEQDMGDREVGCVRCCENGGELKEIVTVCTIEIEMFNDFCEFVCGAAYLSVYIKYIYDSI